MVKNDDGTPFHTRSGFPGRNVKTHVGSSSWRIKLYLMDTDVESNYEEPINYSLNFMVEIGKSV